MDLKKQHIEGPWVNSILEDEARYWRRVAAGQPKLREHVIKEVCDGCKVFGIRTARWCFKDPMWATIPVLVVYRNGRTRLEMRSYCPACWVKLAWVMVRDRKPYFNGRIDVDTALWSYVFRGGTS